MSETVTMDLNQPIRAKDGTLYRAGKGVVVPADLAAEIKAPIRTADHDLRTALGGALGSALVAAAAGSPTPSGAFGMSTSSTSVDVGTGTAGSSTTLADDFPGVDALRAAGLSTVEAVAAKTDQELDDIPNIGPVTVKAITENPQVVALRALAAAQRGE